VFFLEVRAAFFAGAFFAGAFFAGAFFAGAFFAGAFFAGAFFAGAFLEAAFFEAAFFVTDVFERAMWRLYTPRLRTTRSQISSFSSIPTKGIDRTQRWRVLLAMTSLSSLFALFALASTACATAHADRIATEPVISTQESPYNIELVGERGDLLNTYKHRGRFYVEGDSGSRYSIRVTNPTALRVEAVVSVDGLDVIDGQSANFKSKRGYIVPAYGNLVIDGFRVSTQAVAAFRFSSVSSSYAGRKGKARNVGVVGVAIFAEQESAQIIAATPTRPGHRYRKSSHAKRPARPAPPAGNTGNGDFDYDDASSESAPVSRSSSRRPSPPRDERIGRSTRSGLGTAFGEHRHSVVTHTRFQRADQKTPSAFAELRYNNAPGLRALGIVLHRTMVDPGEVALRESASAFPHSRFATPPRSR